MLSRGFLFLTGFISLFAFEMPKVYAHGGDMEEVVVVSVRGQRTLDDTPLRVQILGEGEIREKANMKPGDIRMLLNESTGIQVQQTSATSFSSDIRIQGLDGRYTQLLRDGLPIYAGFSGSLSLLQIAPLDLQQVEVIKGASSTLYGGGAIAGLVNLVSKRPEHDPETAVMLNATSSNGLDLSAFHSREMGQHGMTVFASYNESDAYEPENNGLSAIPEFERVTFTPRWFYEASEATSFDFGLGYIEEERLGGSMDFIDGDAPLDYFEANDTEQTYTRFGARHDFNENLTLEIKNANTWFDREVEVPTFLFKGEQKTIFTEAALSGQTDEATWVLGINHIHEKFDQDGAAPGFDHSFEEHTGGAFGQYTWDVNPELVLDVGLRIDQLSDFDTQVLPRFSVLYMPTPELSLRLGGGSGYKRPNLFVSDAEEIQFINLTPIDEDAFETERSSGYNFDINHRLDLHDWSLTSNLLLFYTEIDDAIRVQEQVPGQFSFEQLRGKTETKGAELNLIFGFDELRYFFGYTYVDAIQETATRDVALNLVSRHRVNNVLVWEREDNFRIGLEAYYFSSQRRENDRRGKDYWIFGLMAEKQINENVTGFLNFENFSDSRQTEYESINNGTLQNPDFRDIYAPLDGFVVNGGFRLVW